MWLISQGLAKLPENFKMKKTFAVKRIAQQMPRM